MPRACLFVVSLTALVVNEVLFDPIGTDTGREFVELFNAGPDAVDLDGIELRFVNGTAPGSPEVVWRGDPHLLESGGFFVVGGDQVGGRDRTVDLGLQNGDEALALVRAGQTLDKVAWGEDLGLGEGAPAAGGRGAAIGRVPDGRDTDDNRADFRELPGPTPGGTNVPANRFDLTGWWTEPAWRETAGPLRLRASFTASGWADRQNGLVTLWGSERVVSAAAGARVELDFEREVTPGPVETFLRVSSGDGEARVGPHRIWCGVADLVITEVQPRPVDGEPEWFELLNRSAMELSLDGWAIRDRGGAARALGVELLGPGERVVFAADAQGLSAFHPSSARYLEPAGGWPTLNDSEPAAGVAADSLHLLAPGGEVVDLVAWFREDIAERGRPLQRSRVVTGEASLWLPAVDGPSPGAQGGGETRAWPAGGMTCRPDPFTPDGDGSADELEVLLDQVPVRSVSVFDLQGDVVRELALVRAGQRTFARWDGTDDRGRPVPTGAWVVVVRLEGTGGVLRQVIGLGRAR